MFQKAKWIWPSIDTKPNERAAFFFDIGLEYVPQKAVLNIGSETKYWLFVNKELVVFDGGLFREGLPGCGYYDTVDIAHCLHEGSNEIAIHVWYYGNGGRNNNYCPKGGLILSSDDLGIYSGENTKCLALDAYYTPSDHPTSHLYGGDHTAYDAKKTPFSLCPSRDGADNAKVLGSYGDTPWGRLVERPVPLLFFSDRIKCEYTYNHGIYTVKLPYAMHFSPYFKVRASEGEKIVAYSDRYSVNGGPGDTMHAYTGHRAEYICRNGEQEFEMLDWIFGESIIFNIPAGVTVVELGYRESGYDSNPVGNFECDDHRVNRLFQKCLRTLKVCMRENYMDCPDRERGQWIGDVSVQAPQIAYLLDKNGLLLLRKAISDFINLRKGDRLVGNVPGDNFSELPSQSLNAISEWGMLSSYYSVTKDKDILALAFEPMVRYLALWETDYDGVVVPRKGNWEWYDHLYNVDAPILNICWYYSALRFARSVAEELSDNRFDQFIDQRMRDIERCFDERYWDAKRGVYASGETVDDRANAMAVLAGLCDKEKYPLIHNVLMSVFNSSTYMENYVLIALCEMGYKQDAFRRMMSRYQPLIDNENSTLWEDFFHLGTRNHAWSGGPATVLFRYFAGVTPELNVEVSENWDISPLRELRCVFVDRNGKENIVIK